MRVLAKQRGITNVLALGSHLNAPDRPTGPSSSSSPHRPGKLSASVAAPAMATSDIVAARLRILPSVDLVIVRWSLPWFQVPSHSPVGPDVSPWDFH